MTSFFDPVVDQIIELIQGQIMQVEAQQRRVRVSIFLQHGQKKQTDKLSDDIRDEKNGAGGTKLTAGISKISGSVSRSLLSPH
jgi:hypothetical protein